MENEKVDIVRQELVEGLREEVATPGNLRTLYETNTAILNRRNKSSYTEFIGGKKARISIDSIPIEIDGDSLHAKIAFLNGSKDISYLIYDNDSNVRDIENVHLLKLLAPSNGRLSPVLMLNDEDITSSVNNEVDYKTAKAITKGIWTQVYERQEKRAEERKSRFKNIKEELGYFGPVIAMGGLALALMYSTVWRDNDTNIGPVKAPSPVEWLVDWNNRPDHMAQGFIEVPDLDVITSEDSEGFVLPVLENNNTEGAPSVYGSFWSGEISEAKEGLYQMSLTDDEFNNTNEVDGEVNAELLAEINTTLDECGGEYSQSCLTQFNETIEEVGQDSTRECTSTNVDVFGPGGLRIFTQDESLPDRLEVVIESDSVKVCSRPGEELPNSTVYIYKEIQE